MWNPFPSTTVRAAAFKTLKRTLLTDQTLEPTQVSSFNQFFDDANLTEAWRYGGGIDQKLGSHAFAGAEYSQRETMVPLTDLMGMSTREPWDETLTRVYLFATPHDWLGVKAQYIRERFDRENLGLGFRELETDRVPLGVGFFHPSGLSASVTATYWNQEGVFEDFFTFELRPGQSDFWLVDAAFSYRLPKRYGFLSVGVANLFDEEFEYYQIDIDNATIIPKRTFFVRFTLAVP